MMTLILLSVLIGLCFGLYRLGQRGLSLSMRVLYGLLGGAIFGLLLNFNSAVLGESLEAFLNWTRLVGVGYVSLLKMIIMPLILVSMIAAVIKLDAISALGRIGGLVLLVLLGTTAIAALIGAFIAVSFGLTAEGLIEGERELARADILLSRQIEMRDWALPDLLLSFLPTNIFLDLTGARPTSIIAVALFGILLGVAGLQLRAQHAALGAQVLSAITVIQEWVMALVRLVIQLTPYGVLALMIKVSASADGDDILNLFNFILASYTAIFLMFVVHGLILLGVGLSPKVFYSKVWPALTFAFSSRSSAATIPLNVEVQTKALGNDPSIANLSATFGASIGQNGCAGIYPAMLAVMIAPTVGIDPMSLSFLVPLILITTVSSFGIAGVGGGATFAALVVLPAMGLPITLVALLISIEPLIDMARTALNVNGSMVAGTVTQRLLGLRQASDDSEQAPV
jgi:L-cystine uptake protein TcyP (sodium:dicarboxylate symporter family)